jgi:hypothetical protein
MSPRLIAIIATIADRIGRLSDAMPRRRRYAQPISLIGQLRRLSRAVNSIAIEDPGVSTRPRHVFPRARRRRAHRLRANARNP